MPTTQIPPTSNQKGRASGFVSKIPRGYQIGVLNGDALCRRDLVRLLITGLLIARVSKQALLAGLESASSGECFLAKLEAGHSLPRPSRAGKRSRKKRSSTSHRESRSSPVERP